MHKCTLVKREAYSVPSPSMQRPIIDWAKSKHAGFWWKLPAFAFSFRDCIWLIALALLATAYGADRWQLVKQHEADSAAMADAKKGAEDVRSELAQQNVQLLAARDALVAQSDEDHATITKLKRHVSELHDELQDVQAAPQFVVGRAGRER